MTLDLFVEPFLGIGKGHRRPPADSPVRGCGIAFPGGKAFAIGQMAGGSFPDADYFPARVVAFRFFVEGDLADPLDLSQVEAVVP